METRNAKYKKNTVDVIQDVQSQPREPENKGCDIQKKPIDENQDVLDVNTQQ